MRWGKKKGNSNQVLSFEKIFHCKTIINTFNRFSKLIGFDKFLWESDSNDLSEIFLFLFSFCLFFSFETLSYETREKKKKFFFLRF